MFILYRVEYPRPVPRGQVENAWSGAGLPQPVPRLSGPIIPPDELRTLVERTLDAEGAVRTGSDGDLEVPRSAAAALAKLEEFYHRMFPENRNSPDRGHFHYEELEWLGEF